jgi:hypothetical protein
MIVNTSYSGRSDLRPLSDRELVLSLAANLARDRVCFDAKLNDPVRFREAISALHEIVTSDLTFLPRDKSAYEDWKKAQAQQEASIFRQAMQSAREVVLAGQAPRASDGQIKEHKLARQKYWSARAHLTQQLRRDDRPLWRRLLPSDPIVTVADDILAMEVFSADESSYGCLTIDRDSGFQTAQEPSLGTTNVDYSQQLFDSFQTLRTYRETRFQVNPESVGVTTADRPETREEKIELPDGWLRGFLQLQASMALPMTKVSLGVDAMYSLLAWLKRHRERTGPRAIRFELQDGRSPRLVLEPWGTVIDSPGTVFRGNVTSPIRVWGRRRLLTLARILPLAQSVDVYLCGTGLPTFWVVQMGSMRLTLGLSGWTTNDWTRGSAVQLLLPPTEPDPTHLAAAVKKLSQRRSMSSGELAKSLKCSESALTAVTNRLALQGQTIFDLNAQVFRWRQVLPMEISDRELGPPHPETDAGRQLVARGVVKVTSRVDAPRSGQIVVGKAENQSCEVLIDGDGIVRNGKCRCSWHFRFGVRNGPCRHLQALRDQVWSRPASPYYVTADSSASAPRSDRSITSRRAMTSEYR